MLLRSCLKKNKKTESMQRSTELATSFLRCFKLYHRHHAECSCVVQSSPSSLFDAVACLKEYDLVLAQAGFPCIGTVLGCPSDSFRGSGGGGGVDAAIVVVDVSLCTTPAGLQVAYLHAVARALAPAPAPAPSPARGEIESWRPFAVRVAETLWTSSAFADGSEKGGGGGPTNYDDGRREAARSDRHRCCVRQVCSILCRFGLDGASVAFQSPRTLSLMVVARKRTNADARHLVLVLADAAAAARQRAFQCVADVSSSSFSSSSSSSSFLYAPQTVSVDEMLADVSLSAPLFAFLTVKARHDPSCPCHSVRRYDLDDAASLARELLRFVRQAFPLRVNDLLFSSVEARASDHVERSCIVAFNDAFAVDYAARSFSAVLRSFVHSLGHRSRCFMGSTTKAEEKEDKKSALDHDPAFVAWCVMWCSWLFASYDLMRDAPVFLEAFPTSDCLVASLFPAEFLLPEMRFFAQMDARQARQSLKDQRVTLTVRTILQCGGGAGDVHPHQDHERRKETLVRALNPPRRREDAKALRDTADCLSLKSRSGGGGGGGDDDDDGDCEHDRSPLLQLRWKSAFATGGAEVPVVFPSNFRLFQCLQSLLDLCDADIPRNANLYALSIDLGDGKGARPCRRLENRLSDAIPSPQPPLPPLAAAASAVSVAATLLSEPKGVGYRLRRVWMEGGRMRETRDDGLRDADAVKSLGEILAARGIGKSEDSSSCLLVNGRPSRRADRLPLTVNDVALFEAGTHRCVRAFSLRGGEDAADRIVVLEGDSVRDSLVRWCEVYGVRGDEPLLCQGALLDKAATGRDFSDEHFLTVRPARLRKTTRDVPSVPVTVTVRVVGGGGGGGGGDESTMAAVLPPPPPPRRCRVDVDPTDCLRTSIQKLLPVEHVRKGYDDDDVAVFVLPSSSNSSSSKTPRRISESLRFFEAQLAKGDNLEVICLSSSSTDRLDHQHRKKEQQQR